LSVSGAPGGVTCNTTWAASGWWASVVSASRWAAGHDVCASAAAADHAASAATILGSTAMSITAYLAGSNSAFIDGIFFSRSSRRVVAALKKSRSVLPLSTGLR
jgi:hypothetical protein